MRSVVLAAAVLAFAGPAAADDLAYRHADGGPSLLEASNGRPYWLLLAECAGFYGAMANTARSDQAAQADLELGVRVFEQALARVRADRNLDQASAIDLLDPHIQRARMLAEANIARDPDEAVSGRMTPRVVMRSSCASLRLAYDAALRS